MTDWDGRMIGLAAFVATWSKDPSTQCGAVIVDNKNRVMGIGYNGFPRGIKDTEARLADRPEKYASMVHAELNAILNSSKTQGMTIYTWPLLPCNDCAKAIIQSGIIRVIGPVTPISLRPRWDSKLNFAASMMKEAGIIVRVWENLDDVQGEDSNDVLISQAFDELHEGHERDQRQAFETASGGGTPKRWSQRGEEST